MNKDQILTRLNELTSYPDFIYVLSRIVLRDFCGTLDDLASRNLHDHLNLNEVKFLMGLWVKNCSPEAIVGYESESDVFQEVYSLLEQLHSTFLPDLSKMLTDQSESPFDFFNDGIFFQEAMFYAGTGAYDYQYTKWVKEKYKYDKKWLNETKSFNIDLLPDFYHSIKTLQQVKLNKLKFGTANSSELLDVFTLTVNDVINKNEEFKWLLDNLILDLNIPQNQFFLDIGDFNILSEKPIVKLPSGLLFLPVPFYLAEAIYEAPFYWMINNEEYKSTALHNRGEIAEEITFNLIKNVFGQSNTLRNLIVKKSKSHTATDIDILAYHGEKAIIFQVKSKKLTSLSKNGDLESIKKDFTKAVKEAYEQGLIASECLKNCDYYTFSLKNEKKYTFDLNIKECFVVTIVLDDYPSITHQTHILLGKEYKEFPVALNVFDLEVVLKYLNTSEKFIDYIEQRVKFSHYFKADNELVYLGFHLKKGLQKFPDSDLVGLDSNWAQFFDKDYYGEISGVNKIQRNINSKIGRNQLCPCGSGNKYKKCHGLND